MKPVSTYEDAKVCGQAMLERLNEVLHRSPQGLAPTLPEFDERYYPHEVEPMKDNHGAWYHEALALEGHPTTGYYQCHAGDPTENCACIRPYWNNVHRTGDVIVCLYNYKQDDAQNPNHRARNPKHRTQNGMSHQMD